MAEETGEQSLEELKADVEAEDKSEAGSQEELDETKDESKAAETEELEGGTDPDKPEDKDSDNASWMDDGSHEVEKEKKYTGTDIGKAKYKATLKAERKSEAEIARLSAEVEELKKGTVKTDDLDEPNRDKYKDEDGYVKEDEYLKDYTRYLVNKNQAEVVAKNISNAEQDKFDQQRHDIENSVSQHYERVEKLAEDSDIGADVIKTADLNVRQMIESVFPDQGDLMTEYFISKLGAGSEKVFPHLGINKTQLASFKEILQGDMTGNKAFVFLGKLSSELSPPRKRKTSANAPAAKVSGGAKPTSLAEIDGQVEEAMRDGDLQKAYNLRDKARKAGVELKRLV